MTGRRGVRSRQFWVWERQKTGHRILYYLVRYLREKWAKKIINNIELRTPAGPVHRVTCETRLYIIIIIIIITQVSR